MAKSCPAPPPETVLELTADLGGRWLVTTQGSQHVWDLDAMTYTRLPGVHSLGGAFAFDGEVQQITRVERWPAVGSYSLLFYDDPADPLRREQWRQSSVIESIERLPDSAPETDGDDEN